MAFSIEQLAQAWEDHDGPAIFTTVDADGVPNAVYVASVRVYGLECFVVADNYFCKTRPNVQAGGVGSFLFRDKSGKTYQVKGRLSYHAAGPLFDFMKSWNGSKFPGHAAAALSIEQVFSGAEQLL